MRIIIIGAGGVGFQLAQKLSKEDHDVTIIESEKIRVRKLQDQLDILVVEGNGASPKVLERAGVERCDLLMAVTNSDEVNIVASISAAQYKVPFKISRVSNMDYYPLDNWLNEKGLGVDLLINPAFECALQIMNLMTVPGASDVAEFGGGQVVLAGLEVQEDAACLGFSLQELRIKFPGYDFLVGAITRQGKSVIPSGQSVVEVGDVVFFVCLRQSIDQIYEFCGLKRKAVNRVMILGGSKVAPYVAKLLERQHIQATLIEYDETRAEQLAEELDRTLIIHGEATNLELLEMEGLDETDAFLALTKDDEDNLLTGLIAKNHRIPVVLALLEKLEYVPLVNKVGVNTAVSSRLAIVDSIMKYVRRGKVLSVASLKGNDAEVVEFAATAQCALLDKPLKDLVFPERVIFAMVSRGPEVFIPTGYSTIKEGDKVVVIGMPESLKRIEYLFA